MKYDDEKGVRRSDLWYINRSPMHYKQHLDEKPEQTKALAFGTAAHKYILERGTFYDEYALIPECDRRTKHGREVWDEFVSECEYEGLKPISLDDVNTIGKMAVALSHNKLALTLLEGAHEKAFYWADDLTGERCKCRVDCLTTYDGKPYIVDYKTTDSCEDGHFERSARKYGYQFQAGMYCEGVFQNTLEEHGFAFVAQEKTPPYATRVYICSPEWIKQGYDKFRELIGIYHNCKVTGNWYGYEGPDGLPVELMGD